MTPSAQSWLKLTLLAAVLDWLAVGLSFVPLEYIAKPLTLASLIGYALTLRRVTADPRFAQWVVVGLGLSLLGDVSLMFEGERWFLVGLVSFLLAHVAYIAAFGVQVPEGRLLAAALLALGVAGLAVPLLRHILADVRERGEGVLAGPVLVYGVVISVMVWAAWLSLLRRGWTPWARALTVGGASLFYLSDALLAWNRFVYPLRRGDLMVHVTYHLGQMALASVVAGVPERTTDD